MRKRDCGVRSSESLSQAEEEIEVGGLAYVLIGVDVRLRVIDVDWVDRRIEVITEIQPNRTNWRMVAQSQTNRMREIVEAALSLLSRRCTGPGWARRGGRGSGRVGGSGYLANIPIRLANSQSTGPCIARICEDIPHVVKEHEAQGISEERQNGRRHAQLSAVDKCASTTDRESGLRVARASRIDGEATQRSRTASVQSFGKWDELIRRWAVCALLAVTRVAGEHEPAFVKAIEAGTRNVESAEFRLSANSFGR